MPYYIIKYQKVSESFIYKYYLYPYFGEKCLAESHVETDLCTHIFINQKVSKKFINKILDKYVNVIEYWEAISRYQEVSEKFMIDNADTIYWGFVLEYRTDISPKFRKFIMENISELCKIENEEQHRRIYEKYICSMMTIQFDEVIRSSIDSIIVKINGNVFSIPCKKWEGRVYANSR